MIIASAPLRRRIGSKVLARVSRSVDSRQFCRASTSELRRHYHHRAATTLPLRLGGGGQHRHQNQTPSLIRRGRRSARFFGSGDKKDENDGPIATADENDGKVDAETESTNSDDDDDNESSFNTNDDDDDDEQQHQQQPHYFPWRNESALPQRLLDRDDYSGMPNNFRARFLRRLIACRELNLHPVNAVPLPFGYAQEWEEELAGNFSNAFELALEELLNGVFGGSGSARVVREDGGLLIDSSSERKEGDDDGDDDDAQNNNVTENNNAYLEQMFDKALIEKYQSSISSDNNNLQLKLFLKLEEATLETIFAVPLLSREIVENKPHLKGGYLNIEKAFSEKRSYQEVKQMTYDLADEIGEDNAYTRTVIADASIRCLEFFQVKDASSGLVVQGMEDGSDLKEVVHNVRFEVVTEKTDNDEPGRKVGSWKIIDIDDMLDGNVFH